MVKKRRFYVVFVAILLVSMLLGSAVSNAGEPEPEYITHRVRFGETLSWIAWRYGVTVQQIVDANNIPNRHRIFAGQTLRIPVERQDFFEYTVQRGDTLTSIAHRFGTTVWEIARLNGIWNVNLIFVGQRLLIPDGVEPPPDNDVPPPDDNDVVFEREAIVITSPGMNDTISSPVAVTGFGSGFENNLSVDILDEDGAVIGQGFVMIDAELGQIGPYTGTVEFTQPATAQPGRVQVYEISPRDGAIEHLNSVTVELEPAS
jgi:LysM repeat protein